MSAPPRCPVCQARFREQTACPRCAADLLPLMRLTARAFRLRAEARAALARGDAGGCAGLAAAAEVLVPSAAGRALVVVSRLLTG